MHHRVFGLIPKSCVLVEVVAIRSLCFCKHQYLIPASDHLLKCGTSIVSFLVEFVCIMHYHRSSLPQTVTTTDRHYHRPSLPQIVTTTDCHYHRPSLPQTSLTQIVTSTDRHYHRSAYHRPSLPQIVTSTDRHYPRSDYHQSWGQVQYLYLVLVLKYIFIST